MLFATVSKYVLGDHFIYWEILISLEIKGELLTSAMDLAKSPGCHYFLSQKKKLSAVSGCRPLSSSENDRAVFQNI